MATGLVSSCGISIRRAVKLSWLREMCIRGALAAYEGSENSWSMFIGGADASWSVLVISGGADGSRACSLSASTDLLILARELPLRLRARGPPAKEIPTGTDEPRKNGGGGFRVKDAVELVVLVEDSRRRGKSGADGNVPIGILFAFDDAG